MNSFYRSAGGECKEIKAKLCTETKKIIYNHDPAISIQGQIS
jgi:hypothetical protein